MTREKVGSQELGLILGHRLFGMEDLHYGLWDEGLEVNLANLTAAQQRFTDYLVSHLPPPSDDNTIRLLDVGCGTGRLLVQLGRRGYAVDGLSPSMTLNRLVRQRLEGYPEMEARLFECRFEELSVVGLERRYDVVLFSESFQFIKMDRALEKSRGLLKPGGLLVILDVFRTAAEGDGQAGDGVIRGGHSLAEFLRCIASSPFEQMRDVDITTRVSPTIALVNDILTKRIWPASVTLGQYLRGHYPKLSWLAACLLRKKGLPLYAKYFGGHYTQQTFERYKSYRHLVYTLPVDG